eukprot:1161796-Pelagomonas_calceolata.AAC.2
MNDSCDKQLASLAVSKHCNFHLHVLIHPAPSKEIEVDVQFDALFIWVLLGVWALASTLTVQLGHSIGQVFSLFTGNC